VHCLARDGLAGVMQLGRIQPGLDWTRMGKACADSGQPRLCIAGCLEIALKAVQLIDHPRRHIGLPSLALRLDLLCVDELVPYMHPAALASDALLRCQ